MGDSYRYPVTMHKTLLIGLLSRCVWALRHHTGAQYLALEQTKFRVVVRKVVARALQLVPANL